MIQKSSVEAHLNKIFKWDENGLRMDGKSCSMGVLMGVLSACEKKGVYIKPIFTRSGNDVANDSANDSDDDDDYDDDNNEKVNYVNTESFVSEGDHIRKTEITKRFADKCLLHLWNRVFKRIFF